MQELGNREEKNKLQDEYLKLKEIKD